MTNLATTLAQTTAEYPDRAAICMDERVLRYRDLDETSARVASWLSGRGIGTGDRVALMLPNTPEFPELYYGILRRGAIVVPMNPLLKSREVEYYLADSGAALILAWHGVADQAAEGARRAGTDLVIVEPGEVASMLAGHAPAPVIVDRAPSDTAVILYTSGTTGQPKGAELTHDNLLRNVEVTRTTLLNLRPGDVVLGALPLFHSFGQVVGMGCAIATGASLSLLTRFDPGRALEIIKRDQVTVLPGVPTMYAAILHSAAGSAGDVASLRLCVSGGAAMPVELLRSFEKEFECVILEGYGLSETSPVASFNHPDRARKPGTIGQAISGVDMRVQDDAGVPLPAGAVGEIAVRGHNVMKGYWGRPEETAEVLADGWLRTGDLGWVDSEGYFSIVDRKKDMIIRGGLNVYPREVEEVLYEHPAVAEAAVIGVRDDRLGEEVAAVVMLKPGASATPDELREQVKSQLAAYKYPRYVWIVAELPHGDTGKILKRAIVVPPVS
ncbi:MAG TPA: long-chain fatty acid--CoA ligase [Streptosporangiaceae bacterium]|nr:long-chain fatty acid--CoA ligase [Streptosporangiaceae bacterium]